METLISSAIGAAIFYFLRNDTDELHLGRTPWVVLAIASWTTLAVYSNPGLEWYQYAVAVVMFAYLLTAGHSMILSDPRKDPCPAKPDWLEKALMQWLYKTPTDTVGIPLYAVYGAARYVLPCLGIGVVMGNPWYALAGAITVIGYWPIAYWVTGGEKTKYIGAAICGAALFGVL